jgi:hypothetical protein
VRIPWGKFSNLPASSLPAAAAHGGDQRVTIRYDRKEAESCGTQFHLCCQQLQMCVGR